MPRAPRIALIGAGEIAAYHLGGLREAGQGAVLIAGRSAASTAALAVRFGVPETTLDWRDALARPDIDAVIIATPDDTHREISLAAARAGKAILLQKPIARSLDEAIEIVDGARSAGVDLQVSFMHRHFEEVVALKDLLAADRLGQVHSLRLRNATPGPGWKDWFFDTARAGGVMSQLGVHGVDLLLQLFGPIVGVSARTATLIPQRRLADGRVATMTTEDTVLASYRFASGVLAQHEVSFNEVAGTDRFRLEVYGTAATAWLRTGRGPLAVATREGWTLMPTADVPLGRRHHARWLQGLACPADRETTAQDALAGLKIVDAVHRSARRGGAEESP